MKMKRKDIIEELGDVIRSFFGDDSLAVTDETSGDDLKEWDSVSHIQLIFEIEEAFDVQFDSDDIPELTSVGAIADKIETLREAPTA
ncbi:MAG: acyl carrier protein [Clostridiales Family XIII bacterium]|nr:acyl carrier protein [Clostridiales Family XIII bacterium]